jgi:hypothetical protein
MKKVRKTVMIDRDLMDRFKEHRGHLSYLVNIWIADYVTKQEKITEILRPGMTVPQEGEE